MARPKEYTKKRLQEINIDLEKYISKTPIPIIAEFAYKHNIRRTALYEHHELKESLDKLRIKGKSQSNEKKHNYEGVNNSTMARYKSSPMFRVSVCFRSNLSAKLKSRGSRKNTKTSKIMKSLGYNKNELMAHLESQFTKEMNWDNYGTFWHIDHKIPDSWFDYSSEKDEGFKQSWCLENLQPMEAKQNISKGGRYYSGDGQLNLVMSNI